MTWYEMVFEVIDMRSFSNLWYWIGLAVLWSTVSHWVLGVPFDMILRARRLPADAEDMSAMDDLHDLVRVNVRRILYISEVSGVWLMLFGSAFLTALTVTATLYDVEFSQAVLLMAVPMAILTVLSVNTARKINSTGDTGKALIRRLMTHRFVTQLIGVVSIFITAMFGMYQNLDIGPIGY